MQNKQKHHIFSEISRIWLEIALIWWKQYYGWFLEE